LRRIGTIDAAVPHSRWCTRRWCRSGLPADQARPAPSHFGDHRAASTRQKHGALDRAGRGIRIGIAKTLQVLIQACRSESDTSVISTGSSVEFFVYLQITRHHRPVLQQRRAWGVTSRTKLRRLGLPRHDPAVPRRSVGESGTPARATRGKTLSKSATALPAVAAAASAGNRAVLPSLCHRYRCGCQTNVFGRLRPGRPAPPGTSGALTSTIARNGTRSPYASPSGRPVTILATSLGPPGWRLATNRPPSSRERVKTHTTHCNSQ